MTEQLERIKATRRGNRAVITKYINEAKEILAKENIDEHARERLKTLHELLAEKLQLVKKFDEEILKLCDVKEIENEIDQSEELNSRVLDIKRLISKFFTDTGKVPIHDISIPGPITPPVEITEVGGISSVNNVSNETLNEQDNVNSTQGPTAVLPPSNPNPIDPPINSASPTFSNQSIGNYVGYGAKTKLPKLVLPRFKGVITEFRPFWDSFENAVHKNTSLSSIDKFNYLYSLLEGPALLVIKGLALTEENYQIAVDILKQRYGNTQVVISAHMDEMLKLPDCSSGKVHDLRKVYDKINVNVRGLEALGVKSEQYGSLLIPVIMSKLPTELRIQVARKTADELWKIDDIIEIIRKELEAREISESVRTSNPRFNDIPKHKDGWRQNRQQGCDSSASSLFVTDGKGERKIKCVYCGQNHYSASCEQVNVVEDRKGILRDKKRCYLCLQGGHRAHECERGRLCRWCNGKHHQSICSKATRTLPKNNTDQPPNKEVKDEKKETPNLTTTTTSNGSSKVLLQTATTHAYSPHNNRAIPVRVLLDSGSQRSYATNHLKKRLGLQPVKKETLNLNTFGQDKFTKQKCDVISLNLKSNDGNDIEVSAVCFEKICSPIPTKIQLDRYAHLKELDLADSSLSENGHDEIDILIGSDYYYDVVIGEVVRGESGPVAVSSKFGWVVSGPSKDTGRNKNATLAHLVIEQEGTAPHLYPDSIKRDDNLTQSLQRFWDTESIGIENDQFSESTKQKEFLHKVHFDKEEGRYEVNLPWKQDRSPKATGYDTCVNRLRQLHSRLKKDKDLLEEYNKVIQQQIDSGIIEAVPDEDDYEGYYLPHHGVLKSERETTKLRVVFDGSAKPDINSPSINECLEKGPNLVPLLFDTIIKFRSYPVGIVSDIEKAFHQIKICPSDRCMLRFLWFDDAKKDNPNIKQFQFRRLVFGLTSSPAILSTVIQSHLSQHEEDPAVSQLLSESLYVDDLAAGADNDDEALQIYERSQEVMKKGGFVLRKWNSNSKVLQERIEKDEKHTPRSSADVEREKVNNPPQQTSASINILGCNWNTKKDIFEFGVKELIVFAKSLPPTKRSVLRASAKLFDPIGVLSPFTVNLKILFQLLCCDRVDWDEELDERSLACWNSLLQGLESISSVEVPRCYFNRFDVAIISQEIHGLSDASEKAYAAVVYLRTEYEDHHVETNIIASKTRVAPIRKQSIPRLELLGAVILARLVSSISKVIWSRLVNPKTFLWTDSFTVLCWIQNDKPWKQYIQRRVDEIRKLVGADKWKFCPGQYNIADLPSRGCSGAELVNNEEWFHGPKFLKLNEEHWPKPPRCSGVETDVAMKETVKSSKTTTHSLVVREREQDAVNIGKIIDCQRFSSKKRLLRVTVYVLRFIRKIKKTVVISTPEITAQELIEAEEIWIKDIQNDAFPEELKQLTVAKGSKSTSSRLNQLHLFLDNKGIVRCEGRIENAAISSESKKPILLPPKHHFTDLIIQENHNTANHIGIKGTLNRIRERYWILHGRQSVKRTLRKCVTCKRLEGKPYPTPKTPQLPAWRTSDEPPFTYTGLDFAGPLNVKESSKRAEQSSEKSYIALFTCASTRAMHLELLKNLSTESFLQAFRRFSSRRGLPKMLLSDNAKTFKSASKELSRIKRSSEVQQHLANKGVTWRFITEKAPWHGGFWERLIKSVKRCLKKSIGRAMLTFEEMRTILVEIETTLNNRPITYVYDDEEGISYPLTPSNLIYGRRTTTSPNESQWEIVCTNESLTRRAKHHRKLLHEFTNQWRREYLLSILESARARSNKVKDVISVGDVVILKNENTKRLFWKLSKVEELIRSEDGVVRSAKIRVLNSETRNPIVIRRPIQHLIPLEIRCDKESVDGNKPQTTARDKTMESSQNGENEKGLNNRPKRQAAVLGDAIRKLSGQK